MNPFPPLASQREIDRQERQQRRRETLADIIGGACLFIALFGGLWIAAVFAPALH